MLGEEGKDGEMMVIVSLMSDRLEATASYLFLSRETDHTSWRRLAIGCSKNNRKFLVLSLPRPTYTASSHNHRPLPLYYLLQTVSCTFPNAVRCEWFTGTNTVCSCTAPALPPVLLGTSPCLQQENVFVQVKQTPTCPARILTLLSPWTPACHLQCLWSVFVWHANSLLPFRWFNSCEECSQSWHNKPTLASTNSARLTTGHSDSYLSYLSRLSLSVFYTHTDE